jgi:CubicO group peptidase (beta-lactamase class C family)
MSPDESCIAVAKERLAAAPAVALAATSPGTGDFTWSTGSTPGGDPVTSRTPMYAASITKQFLAALVGRAVLDGRLDPDDTLDRFLALPAWAGQVRVRHLVHHIAALPSTSQLLTALDLEDMSILDNALVVRALTRIPALDEVPGAAFAYSNTGYVLLAEILRAVRSADPAELLRDELLRPLRLDDSDVRQDPLWPQADPPPRTVGDGGLWATAPDLLRWLEALNGRVLGGDLTDLLQTPGRLDDGTPLDYAWGMAAHPASVGTTYTHGGTWPGWTAKAVRNPATRTAVALLTRSDDDQLTSDVALELHDLLVRPPGDLRS